MGKDTPVNGFRHDRHALVAYGSETGAAQDVAEELQRLARRLHFRTRFCELDDNDLAVVDVVLIAISTTGQGDLPANSRKCWRRLRNARLKLGCLTQVRFASFGLGDSSYPKYNWAHRKLHSRLQQLGAQSVCERGESDEQHPEGVDGQFVPWLSKLRTTLLEQYPLPDGVEPIADETFLDPDCQLQFAQLSNGHAGDSGTDPCEGLSNLASWDHMTHVVDGTPATLDTNERLTPESHWQDVRLLDFTIPSRRIYEPSDVLTIFPKNFPTEVDHLIALQDWTSIADAPLIYCPTDPFTDPSLSSLPHPLTHDRYLTLRALFTHDLDITAIPRRSFFASIAHFASDSTQKERLIEFTDPKYIDEFYDYTTRPRRSILEVLQEFDSVRIPLKWVCSIFPRIRGRQFSIASGGELKQNADGSTRVQLLVAIVKYRTVIKKLREGLCTRYLAALQPGATLTVQLVKGGMKVNLHRPAIMIGPGTGVAPLRSLMLERLARERDTNGAKGEGLLFFGARNRSADYFFEHDWTRLQMSTNLTVHAAFSRDQKQKVYVQDLIREQSKEVYSLLQADGVVYVCGSSGQMPKSVREALVWVVEREGEGDGMVREEAESFVEALEKSGRYQQETW
ncbi:MAG: NAPDH-dependent diflavin reductase [Chrysothrix sp. TS-e1954]|nr:MAG: NAPDH-dependent diflavin reductase [Chrysothrix sp. TS-e1954]